MKQFMMMSMCVFLVACGSDGKNGLDGEDGINGVDGSSGADGINTLIETSDIPNGEICENGGIAITVGLDANSNGVLDETEITQTSNVCNGEDTPNPCNMGPGQNCVDAELIGRDFSYMQLTGIDFSGADLRYANFEGAILTGANFSNANLQYVNLEYAIYDGANFSNAMLQDINWGNNSINAANFASANLEGADFSRIYINNCNFENANLNYIRLNPYVPKRGTNELGYSNFDGASLRYSSFSLGYVMYSSFVGADFSYATLFKANLLHADLTGAVFYKAAINEYTTLPDDFDKELHDFVDFSGNSDFSNQDLSMYDFRWIDDLTGYTFNNANLSGVVFDNTVFTGCSFEMANLQNAQFIDTSILQSNLNAADLSNSYFKGTNSSSTNTRLESSEFIDAIFNDAVFINAAADSNDFTNATMQRMKVLGARIGSEYIGNTALPARPDWTDNIFINCDLTDASFVHINYSGGHGDIVNSIFDNVTVYYPPVDDLVDAVTDGDPSFKGMPDIIADSDFQYVGITAIDMDFLDISNADISNAYIYATNVDGSSLIGANASHTTFDTVFIRDSIADDMNLSHAILKRCSLLRTSFKDVNFSYADLSNNVSIDSQVDFCGADFSNANLRSVIGWYNAKLDQTTIFDNTICPDGTLSDFNADQTCIGHYPDVGSPRE